VHWAVCYAPKRTWLTLPRPGPPQGRQHLSHPADQPLSFQRKGFFLKRHNETQLPGVVGGFVGGHGTPFMFRLCAAFRHRLSEHRDGNRTCPLVRRRLAGAAAPSEPGRLSWLVRIPTQNGNSVSYREKAPAMHRGSDAGSSHRIPCRDQADRSWSQMPCPASR
jgi:hypothetical protein